jgi:D-alanyl-D-alanine carboxypeptidase
MLGIAAFVVVSNGCGGGSGAPAALERPDLQRKLEGLAHVGQVGAVALVRTPAGEWRGAIGQAFGDRAAAPDDRFAIASTTKTFVAAVVLQLVGEGRLSLDDRVERRLPGLLRHGEITIRQLLNHTSGLPQTFTFEEAASGPLLFEPGSDFSYANANYVALGRIVEKVTGRNLADVVEERIIRPLELEHTSYGTAGFEEDGPDWLGGPETPTGEVSGDGGIVSTAGDVATFFGALMSGKVLRPRLLATMRQTVPTPAERPGLGIFRWRLSCGAAWGHGGTEPQYSTMALSSADGTKTVVAAMNTFDFDDVLSLAKQLYCDA